MPRPARVYASASAEDIPEGNLWYLTPDKEYLVDPVTYDVRNNAVGGGINNGQDYITFKRSAHLGGGNWTIRTEEITS